MMGCKCSTRGVPMLQRVSCVIDKLQVLNTLLFFFFGGGSAHHLILRSAQFASGEFIGSRASHLRIHPVFTRCAAGTSAPCRPAGVAVRVVQRVQRSQQWRLTLRIGGFLQLICRLKNSGFRVDGTDSKMSFSWGSI